jgi:hypothetical protein
MLPAIKIGAATTVIGQIYADGNISLNGSVEGHISCRSFMVQSHTAFYDNYLLDATIDVEKRSSDFVGSSLIGDKQSKQAILKWLK